MLLPVDGVRDGHHALRHRGKPAELQRPIRAEQHVPGRWAPRGNLTGQGALPAPSPGPDAGSLRGDLLARFHPWLRQLNQKPYERIIAGLLAQTQADPEFAKLYREHFVAPRRDETRRLLLRAIDRGEIAPDTNLEVTLDLLYGPIYHRLLHRHAPLNDRFAAQVIDAVIAAISTGGLPTGRPSRSKVATRPAPRRSAATGQ